MNKTSLVITIFLAITVATAGVFFFVRSFFPPAASTYRVPTYSSAGWLTAQDGEKKPRVSHLKTPEPLKAVYMTSCVAGTPSLRVHLVQLVRATELNAVVVDLKDYTGRLSFRPDDEELASFGGSACPITDLRGLVKELHVENIYVIGRITVFQDPTYAQKNQAVAVKRVSDPTVLWADKKGINYIDPGARDFWNHIAAIAEDAYGQGVDELNFDYIRFPSDGNMQDISFPVSGGRPKPEVLEEFFSFLNQKLKPTGMVISADVFGMIATSYVDIGIGQLWERTIPYFDYVAPMVYPSHYYLGSFGYTDPNSHPYEIVKLSLAEAIHRTMATTTLVATKAGMPIASTTPQLFTKMGFDKSKVRPWLQDFDYPVPYTPAMVKDQIQATCDLGLTSWMMWDPSNRYTREVYQVE